MHMKIGVDSSGERSLIFVSRSFEQYHEGRTFLMVDCLPVFENPSNGFPERIETEVPSKLLAVADDASSPYTVAPLSSTNRTNLSTLMAV